jgi:hypothetical protein
LSAVFFWLSYGAPRSFYWASLRVSHLARIGPSTVYSVPFLPGICVELGAAALVVGSMAADDVIADDAAELEDVLDLLPGW